MTDNTSIVTVYAEVTDGVVVGTYRASQALASNWMPASEHVRVGMAWHDALMGELDAKAQRSRKEDADRAAKLTGIEFEGVMCSATKEDQDGLLAVLTAHQLQGAAFATTRYEFTNGNTLVISGSNIDAFIAAWLPFRQSFFLAEGPQP